MNFQKHVDYLVQCVRDVEVEKGVVYLEKLTTISDEAAILNQVIQLFLNEIGEMWQDQRGASLADCYISSKIVKEYLGKIQVQSSDIEGNKIVVIGNITNDFQSSGRQLVVRYLEMAGWIVYDLGNNVSPDHFIEEARLKKAQFIAVSAMLYENALHIKDLVDKMEKAFKEEERPYLVAGGAVFNVSPTLAASLGVAYTATNAYEALKLFNYLSEEVDQ